MTAPGVAKPTFEHHASGLGIGRSKPRISWQFTQDTNTASNWTQTAYEVEVKVGTSDKPEVFRIENPASVLVPWPSTPLQSRDFATVRIRSHGKSGDSSESPTEWSEPTTLEAGLNQPSDWTSSFITSATRIGEEGPLHPLRFRKSFDLKQIPSRGRLYISACGVYNVFVNGHLASDEQMAPGWTSYKYRHNYRTLDVTSLLKTGANTIAVEAAEGWYCGRLGFKGGKRLVWGKDIAVLAQLEADGTKVVGTDDSWESAPSAIVDSQIYDGETYDLTREQGGWKTGSAGESLGKTRTLPFPEAKMVSSDAPPVRVTQELKPREIFETPSGKVVVDFGQNLVGKVLVKKVQLAKGAKLSFKHAEVMENEELGIRPLRYAKVLDTLIGDGSTIENWSPSFTFHGFRYMQVDGWPTSDGIPNVSDLTAVFMHSDMKRRGTFECSNPSVNQLHSNVVMSMRGNFLSIPTDCPQRDERLGWTGDLQAFAPSATFLYDTVGMLGNWLEDLMAEQLSPEKGGIPPLVVPDVLPPNWPHTPQAVWDDVTIMTPHALYKHSADTDLLARQLPSAQAYINAIDRGSDELWSRDLWQLSDWLDPAAPPDAPGSGRTDDVLVADAFLVHITDSLATTCAAMGRKDLAEKYAADAAKHRQTFQHKYISPYGNLMCNTQTAIALAVQYDLYRNKEELKVAAANLRKLVRYSKFRIATGFAGTPVVTHALTTTCQPQLAYRMLLEKKCPSWMYPVTMGATTIWERWDSMLPDGKINPGEMTSFNHYALGAVADWLHTTVAGISPLEPGWKVIKVRPVPGGNVTSAKASFDGPYGMVSCEWKLDGKDFKMKLTVPPNSTAQVTLPSEITTDVTKPEEPFKTVGSGVHEFACQFEAGEWPPTALWQANQIPSTEDTIAT